MIEIYGGNYPSKPSEFTVEQYEKVANVYSRENSSDPLERMGKTISFCEIFEIVGVPDADIKKMRRGKPDYFNDKCKEFNEHSVEDITTVSEIEVKGYKYSALRDGEFYITPDEQQLIRDKYAKGRAVGNIAYMIGVIFKREDLTDEEHYTPAHIQYKAELFAKNMKASVAIPYIFMVLNVLNDLAKREAAEEPEQVSDGEAAEVVE